MARPAKPKRKKYRRRGTGSISYCKRLERWEARVPRQLGRTASYHERKRDAEAWLDRVLAAHQERTLAPGADETLGAYLARWGRRMEAVFGPSRLRTARQMVGKAEPLWPIVLADLRWNHIADWAATMIDSGLASSTVQLHKQVLAQALGDLVPDVLPSNPAARPIRLPRPPGLDTPEHLEELEAQRLLRATYGTPGYPLWRLLLGTGLRVGEALGLRWEDLDRERGRATFAEQWSVHERGRAPTKTRQPRTVTLTRPVLDALLELPHRTGLLFPGRTSGHPLGRTTVKVWFAAALAAAELSPDLTPHALRHTFASVALARGVPVTDVAQALGHRSPGTTMQVYSHALQQRQGVAEQALEAALAGFLGPIPVANGRQ